LMANGVANYLLHNSQPARMGTAHPQLVPYQAFPTRDGFLFVAGGNQGLWERLCRTLDAEALLSDERFSSNQQRVNNREACVDAVTNLFADYDTEPLRVKLREARVPCTPVNDYAAVMADGQIDALGVIVSGEDPDYGEFKVPGLPFSISNYQPAPPKTAPRVGEHTREVLLEIGYSDEKIDRLKEVGALG